MMFDPTYPHKPPFLPANTDIQNSYFTDILVKARAQLAELKGTSKHSPNSMLLISPFVIMESVASSNIENINTTLVEVLQSQLFPEAEQRPADKEVLRYRDAILWGFENLNSYSISTRLILGIQNILIPSSEKGYRKQQNKIENTTTKKVLYTPPIASDIPELMSNWENYANEDSSKLDPLIKASILHHQFESIHPFSDGNGRTGRILMVLQLIKDELIALPILYISGYINENRSSYYKLLNEVTATNNWNGFIDFMLKGFYSQALEGNKKLLAMNELHSEFKEVIKKEHPAIYNTVDLIDAIFSYPFITPAQLSSTIGIHRQTASKYLTELVKSKLLEETTHKKYHLFINKKLLDIISNSEIIKTQS